MALRIFGLLLFLAGIGSASAQEPVIPYLWDTKERLAKPDVTQVKRLRFLTTVDFPPFNFIDRQGRLAGFHVDLARAICTELDIVDRCQIQALPWGELETAIEKGDGEVIAAGLSIGEDARQKFAFSRPFLLFPARFVAMKSQALTEPLVRALKDLGVGVIAGSAHERALRDYFPMTKITTYERQEQMLADLRAGKVTAVFGDGMRLGFWLASSEAGDCCRFAGGPYLAPEYLGSGLALATSAKDEVLVPAFDYAIQQLSAKGTMAELYLRYFPVSFY